MGESNDMKKSEGEIQAEIILEASKRGHRLYRSNAGTIQTKHGGVVKLYPRGYPDLTGFRKGDGKFVVIEVKKPSGRLSEHLGHLAHDLIIDHPCAEDKRIDAVPFPNIAKIKAYDFNS